MTRIFSLKNLAKISCVVAVIATSYHLLHSFGQVTTDNSLDHFQKTSSLARLITDIALSVMAVFIGFKGKAQKGSQLFAMFLAALVLNDSWFYRLAGPSISILLLSLEAALTASLFVAAFQFFPNPINQKQIDQYIRLRPLRKIMGKLLKARNLWLIFMPIIFALSASFHLLSLKLPYVALNLVIILCGFAYMYISYKKVGINSRSSILWLFWGVLSHIILVVFSTILHIFNPSDNSLVNLVISIAGHLVLLLMIFMSVFFADSFDTGFIIKRTIVDGALFIAVILVYNVVEHYLLHTINHTLHINDAFLASLLSGILVLVISPLHHKLNTFLNKKFRSGNDSHQH